MQKNFPLQDYLRPARPDFTWLKGTKKEPQHLASLAKEVRLTETRREIRGWKRTLGITLFVLSFAFYGFLLIVPFVALTSEAKAALSIMLVVLGESSFWLSVIVLGREIIDKYRKIEWRSQISLWLKQTKAGGDTNSESYAQPDDQQDADHQI